MEAGRWSAFWNSRRGGCALLGILVLAFFADLLLGPGNRVVSNGETDVFRQFAGWRAFGFGEIRKGNFPLWTPMVYGGMPYFSGFQSALLYPPNWLYLVLPLGKAINAGVILHAWWLGAGTFLWTRMLGGSQRASLFSGALIIFCAPHFLHVFAGHLTNLCVMAWMPWLFMSIRHWRKSRERRSVLLGAGVVAMEILAGHPQYVYYGAISAGIYAGLQLFLPGGSRVRFIAGFVAIYLIGALLASVQLLPGIEATAESLRAVREDKGFSGSYSFPPENLFTALVPGIFGDMRSIMYWGRWFLWEMQAYLGVAGLWCAAVGAFWGKGTKESRVLLAGAGATVVLALGAYTPLFGVLYALLPGFDLFRGTSKFMFFAALFAAPLGAMGIDLLSRRDALARERALHACGAAAAIACALAAWRIAASGSGAGGAWGALRRWIWQTAEVTHVPESRFFDAEFAAAAAQTAARGCGLAAAVLLVALLCTGLRRRWKWGVPVLMAAGLIEVVGFAARYRDSFAMADLLPRRQMEMLAQTPGDYRVIDLTQSNRGMLSGGQDLWGDDPGVAQRYAEFIAMTQGVEPEKTNQHLPIRKIHRHFDLLRVRHVFERAPNGETQVREISKNPLRRFELLANYRVIPERETLLETLFDERFDPRQLVLLETVPPFKTAPRGGEAAGQVRIDSQDTDEVRIQVEVDRPCILLMTDPYCKGWHAANLSGSAPQEHYEILPANYALRAIPLEAGAHLLRIYYMPRSLPAGAAASGLAWLAWAGCLWGCWRRIAPRPADFP